MPDFSPGMGERMTTKIDEYARYQTKPGYVLREVLGEFLTIPVSLPPDEKSRMAVLNEEGKFLWEQLRTDRTVDELVEAMTENYEVTAAEARADILEFLQEMDKNALLLKKSEVVL